MEILNNRVGAHELFHSIILKVPDFIMSVLSRRNSSGSWNDFDYNGH